MRDVLTDTAIAGAEVTFECNGSKKTIRTDKWGSFKMDLYVDGCCSGHSNNKAEYYLERSLLVKVQAGAKGHSPEKKTLTFSTLNLPDLLTVKGEVHGGDRALPLAGAQVSIELPNSEVVTDTTDEHGRYEMTLKPFLTSNHTEQTEEKRRVDFILKPTRLSAKMIYRPAKLGVNCEAFPAESAIVLANHDVPVTARLYIELDGKPVKKGWILLRPKGFYRDNRKIGYVWHQFPGPLQSNVKNGWTDEFTFDSPKGPRHSSPEVNFPVYGRFSVRYDDKLIKPNTYETELDYLVLSMLPTVTVTPASDLFNDGEVDFSQVFQVDMKAWGIDANGFDVSVKTIGDVYFHDTEKGEMVNSWGQGAFIGAEFDNCTSKATAKFTISPTKRSINLTEYMGTKDIDPKQLEKNLTYIGVETFAHEGIVKVGSPNLADTGWIKAPGYTTTAISIAQLVQRLNNSPLVFRN